MAQVAIVMGSNSDLPVVQGAIDQLKSFGVDFEAHVISAHRTPQRAEEFAKSAKENGVKVIIAAAGKAAHGRCNRCLYYFAGYSTSNKVFVYGRA